MKKLIIAVAFALAACAPVAEQPVAEITEQPLQECVLYERMALAHMNSRDAQSEKLAVKLQNLGESPAVLGAAQAVIAFNNGGASLDKVASAIVDAESVC